MSSDSGVDRPRVAVATSGGRDSTALLHATIRQMRGIGGEVIALHVHHGLQDQADHWMRSVDAQAHRWGAKFLFRRLTGKPPPGESIEAWARRGRYAALADMARQAGCGIVLLAHHRRDQAETFVLQALRGAGPSGLAAMPQSIARHQIVWARPWLSQPREAIEAYVARHRLGFVDDDSNDNPRFARSRLRLQVWPALTASFPDAEVALVEAASGSQWAARLAQEVLAVDLPSVISEGKLHLGPWLALPPARRRNVLKGWLCEQMGRGPANSLVERLSRELQVCSSGSWFADGHVIRLYRRAVHVCKAQAARIEGAHAFQAKAAAAARDNTAIGPMRLSMPGEYRIDEWGGTLAITAEIGRGAAAMRLDSVCLRGRTGSERFRLTPTSMSRSLKKQYQSCGVPAWNRSGPLLFDRSGQLVFVPGLGIDAGVHVGPGEPGLNIVWKPSLEACP